ncbi:MAG: FdhF/YdeP family oxidoreductase [Bryobacterales bacterium]|nr:FdhF/YdeP family oxidoreductase [Bryobacterales bacterium]
MELTRGIKVIMEIRRTWRDRLMRAVPLGLGRTKPKSFTDMAKIAWKNRDNAAYGWKVLQQGVCDGCALGVAGFRDWTIDGIHLCMTRLNLLRLNTMPELPTECLSDVSLLAQRGNAELREMGRLAFPMVRQRGEPGFRRIAWQEAYDRIARGIRAAAPERLAFYLTSRALTNETYYVAQKFARFLGTNNVDNAARLCHSPSTGAMKSTLGVAATTCSYKDWFGADLIVFFGSNPANDQPVTIKYLHDVKRGGTKVVLVNPYREPGMDTFWVPSIVSSALFGTEIMDHWFRVAPGGDIAFLHGVLKVVFERGWEDKEFVSRSTTGVDGLRAACLAADWDRLERDSGQKRSDMEDFATLVAKARNAVLVWSMGITQHVFGGDAVRMIVNLGLARGYIGRDKCGLMPIRGHSGVQGGAEMGAYATAFPGGLPLNRDNALKLSEAYGFKVPDRPGLMAAEMVEAAARGELEMLYCVGGNFLRTLPDPDYVSAAMRKVPLRVHQDLIVTDQMLLDPAEEVILLPAKTRYEQDGGGTQTSTERRVMYSPEIPRQVGEAKAEWKIFRELAVAVDPDRSRVFGCSSGQEIRQEIASVIPAYDGIQTLRATGDSFQYGGPHLCEGGVFPTPDRKAHFAVVDLPDRSRQDGEFIVSTRRGKQFNTLIYGETDPITGASRDAVLINPDDAARLHLKRGDPVLLRNGHGTFEGRAFPAAVAPGSLQIHWPEGNLLLPRGRVDATGGVPDYNATVRLEAQPL